VNSWRLRYQPFLYEMPVSVGKYPAGTILCAGNSILADLSYTKIDVHASFDKEIHVEICLPRSLRGYGNSRQWNSCHLGAPSLCGMRVRLLSITPINEIQSIGKNLCIRQARTSSFKRLQSTTLHVLLIRIDLV